MHSQIIVLEKPHCETKDAILSFVTPHLSHALVINVHSSGVMYVQSSSAIVLCYEIMFHIIHLELNQ